jgi:hypothetical protein
MNNILIMKLAKKMKIKRVNGHKESESREIKPLKAKISTKLSLTTPIASTSIQRCFNHMETEP